MINRHRIKSLKGFQPVLSKGFTLFEMVIVLIIAGIMSGLLALFIKYPVDNYFDLSRRAELSYWADSSVRRFSRDIQSALPNTIRVLEESNGNQCVEYLPIVGGGRSSSVGTGVLNILATQSNMSKFSAGNHYLVINNLGFGNADAYQSVVTTNRVRIATANSEKIQFDVTKTFPVESDTGRFYIIPNHSSIYSCVSGKLYRSDRALGDNSLPALTACPNTGALLVSNVVSCDFNYSIDDSALSMRLRLSKDNEQVFLFKEMFIDNAP